MTALIFTKSNYFIFLYSTEIVIKFLNILSVGIPKVIFFVIKECYYGNKITIINLKKVYVKSLISSQIKSFICMLCIFFIYPHIHDYVYYISTRFAPIVAFCFYMKSLFVVYKPDVLCATANTPTPSFSMQLGTLSHTINFSLSDLSKVNYKFEEQFDKAKLSGSDEDIILARKYKDDISEKREKLLSVIKERELLADKASSLYPRADYKYFTNISSYNQTILNMSYTYLHVKN